MKIAILGLGAYGIALAKVFNENGNHVAMWSKFQDEVDIISLKRENINMLPGVKIPQEITITSNLGECLNEANIIILAVPMMAVRGLCKEINAYMKADQVICIVSKGIEQETNLLMSQVVYEETGSENVCMIAGPTFAVDLEQENEMGMVVASTSDEAKLAVKLCLENERIAVSTSSDMIGVQIAAACKNVFAILLGILGGREVSASTKASVLAIVSDDLRIIVEILGGKERTIFTYAGLGDLLLTSMNSKSRNYTFGMYLGQGMNKEEALSMMKVNTIEGLYTLESLNQILKDKEIQIKSVEVLYKMVYHGMTEKHILKYIKR